MRRRSSLFCILLVALGAVGTRGETRPKWIQIRLPEFLVISDAPERRLRATTARLEQFRQAIGVVLPRLATRSPVPTVVVVLAGENEMREYQPRHLGEIKNVGGYFQPGNDINYIAMAADSARGFQIVAHEYVHFLIDNTDGDTPTWFGEGMAQLYQTLEVDGSGANAIVGGAPAAHLDLLRRAKPIPLLDMMHVDEPWTTFHDSASRGLFYAQSWALVHYLVLGSPERTGQLDAFLALRRRGEPVASAFTGAFHGEPAALEAELARYIRRVSLPRSRQALAAGEAP